jgi:hypothetical protein
MRDAADGRGIDGHYIWSPGHDPEKWNPAFRKDHAPNEKIEFQSAV